MEKTGPQTELSIVKQTTSTAGKFRQYFAAISACLGALVAGTAGSWSSPANGPLVREECMGFPVTEDEYVIISCLMPLGAMVFCAVAGICVEHFGKRNFLLSLALPFIIGWCLLLWPSSVYMLYLGRFISGIGCGPFCAVAPSYITELAEKNIRGTLSSFYTLFFIIGIVYSPVVGAFVTLHVLTLSCLVLTILFGLFFAFQPETPAYYLRCGQTDKARETLQYFRGKDFDVSKEFKEMEDRELRRKQCKTLKENLKNKTNQRAMYICLFLQLFQQGSGIEALFFYQKGIMEQSNLSFSADTAVIIVGLIHLLFTCFATAFVDRLGRKPLLIISGGIISVCCGMLSIYYSLDENFSQTISYIPVIAMGLFRAVFALGYGPVPWVIVAEILTEEMKNLVAPLTAVFGWFLVFLSVVLFPYAFSFLGMNVTWLLCGMCSFASAVYVIFYVPETKRKSLNEIQDILEDGSSKKKFKLQHI